MSPNGDIKAQTTSGEHPKPLAMIRGKIMSCLKIKIFVS